RSSRTVTFTGVPTGATTVVHPAPLTISGDPLLTVPLLLVTLACPGVTLPLGVALALFLSTSKLTLTLRGVTHWALVFSTNEGCSVPPLTCGWQAVPGPPLQPHQLFVASTGAPAVSMNPRIRLKWI